MSSVNDAYAAAAQRMAAAELAHAQAIDRSLKRLDVGMARIIKAYAAAPDADPEERKAKMRAAWRVLEGAGVEWPAPEFLEPDAYDEAKVAQLIEQGRVKENKMKARCKVQVESVTRTGGPNYPYERVKFVGVAADEIPENQAFNRASPAISFEIGIANRELHGKFNPQDQFYVDFTPA